MRWAGKKDSIPVGKELPGFGSAWAVLFPRGSDENLIQERPGLQMVVSKSSQLIGKCLIERNS